VILFFTISLWKKSSYATRFIEFDYFQAENTPRVFLTNSCLNNSIVAADFFSPSNKVITEKVLLIDFCT
jgi:hypothetical protein